MVPAGEGGISVPVSVSCRHKDLLHPLSLSFRAPQLYNLSGFNDGIAFSVDESHAFPTASLELKAHISPLSSLGHLLIFAVIPKLFQEYLAIFQLSSVGLCSIIEASFSCDIKT